MPTNEFLFISPHLDDAALSCGGMLQRMTQLGCPITVVTVFTDDATPNQKISWLAKRNHLAWELPLNPFVTRREEDQKAMETLGVKFVHLGFQDIIYRVDGNGNTLYQEKVLDIPLHATDVEKTLPQLAEKFNELIKHLDGYVFCPLTLGKHVDHILVRKAIEAIYPSEKIIYYEDFPYTSQGNNIQDWLQVEKKQKEWLAVSISLSEAEISARIDAVACYRSQLRGLFPSVLERFLEIIRARLNLLETHRFSTDSTSTINRMKTSLYNYIQSAHGERYWLLDQESQTAFFQLVNSP